MNFTNPAWVSSTELFDEVEVILQGELFESNGITHARLKGHQGSGNIAGIAMSDGLTVIQPEEKGRKGDRCKIILL